jgi:hypothetical protein
VLNCGQFVRANPSTIVYTIRVDLLLGDGARCGELGQLGAQGVVVRGATQEVAQRLDEGGGLGGQPVAKGMPESR